MIDNFSGIDNFSSIVNVLLANKGFHHMELIDTHAHIYIDDFKLDFEEMMLRASDASIVDYYLPAIDSSHTESMLALESPSIHLMMGLHPCSIKPDSYLKELNHVETWLAKRPFCAIGEIGIDLHWDQSTFDIQVEAFEAQIDWAIAYDLPIIIHSRKSTQEVIAVLKRKQHSKLRGIFHCFGGSIEEANAIIDLGFLLGIGGVVTFKNAGLDKTVAHLDLQHLVLETDSPYLAPVPHRGKRNEPSYLYSIAQKVADVMKISLEEVAEITTSNAKKIFSQ